MEKKFILFIGAACLVLSPNKQLHALQKIIKFYHNYLEFRGCVLKFYLSYYIDSASRQAINQAGF